MGDGPQGMSRHHMSRHHMSRHHVGRPSGFAGPGNDRIHPKSKHGRGVQSGSRRSRDAGRGNDRGPGGLNRPVDHDQRMEQMKQFFGGQFGNRGPSGLGRGPRGKEDSDNKSDRNNRSNMRPDFPQRGPGMERSFGPPRINSRGGDRPSNRGFDRRDINQIAQTHVHRVQMFVRVATATELPRENRLKKIARLRSKSMVTTER